MAELRGRRRAAELSPLDWARAEQWCLYYERRYDELIAENRRSLQLHPDYANGHSRLGKAYLQKGLHREAIAEFEWTLRLDDRTGTHAWLGYAHAVSDYGIEPNSRA